MNAPGNTTSKDEAQSDPTIAQTSDFSRRTALRGVGVAGLVAALAQRRQDAAAAPAGQRCGSTQLLGNWFGDAAMVDEAHLAGMLELAQLDGVEHFDWWPLGKPRELDAVVGTIQVRPEIFPDVVARLTDMASTWRHWEVFPYGITVPDLFEVQFSAMGEFPVEELPGL